MALDHNDFVEIKKVLDDRYVMQSDCNERQSSMQSKFANDDKRIDMIVHDFGTIKSLLWLVAGACITSAVAAVFGIIFN